MSDHAALLRRAAKLVSETDRGAVEGRWAIWEDLHDQGYITVGDEQGVLTEERPYTEMCNPVAKVYARSDAAHIALWHPGVALAVAEWLDQHAAAHDIYECRWDDDTCAAIKTARAVLGEEPTE